MKNRARLRIDAAAGTDVGSVYIAETADPAPPALQDVPAPENLALTTAIERSAVTPAALIAATWSAPSGSAEPQYYAVQWSTDSGFADGVTSGFDAPQPSCTITGLKTATTYYVRVAAVYRAIQSPWTAGVSIATADDTTPPDPVSGAAGDFTTGDLILTWTNPTSANLRDVRVRVYASNGGALLREVYSATGRYTYTAQTNYLDTSGSPDPSLYVVLTARSWSGYYSTDVTLSPSKSAPSTPAGVAMSWDGDAGTAGPDLVISWTLAANTTYRLTLDGVARDVYGDRYIYTLDANRAEHSGTPDYAVTYSLVAIDRLLQTSSAASGTATNAAPPTTSATLAGGFSTIAITITRSTAADLRDYTIRIIKDSVTLATYNSTSIDQVYQATAAGSYQVGVVVNDVFGRSGAETVSGAVVIDSLTITELRAETTYTDDLGTSQATLSQLKDDVRASGGLAIDAGIATTWHWVRADRALIERHRVVTISASAGIGYIGTSTDGSTWTWFSGPLGVDGRTLTAVASEVAAQAAAIALPLSSGNMRWELPTLQEARYVRIGHKNTSAAGYSIYEYYPRRLVEGDDIRGETVTAINIKAASITADRMSVTQLSAIAADMGSITAGTITGGTIQTAATGARVVLSSAAYGGLIGYSGTDTYNPADGTGTYQVLWKKTDGKFYTGGGNVILSSTGISVLAGTGTIGYFDPEPPPDTTSVIWTRSSNAIATVDAFEDTQNVLRLRGIAANSKAGRVYIKADTVSGTSASLDLIGSSGAAVFYGTSFGIHANTILGGSPFLFQPDTTPANSTATLKGTIRLPNNLYFGASQTTRYFHDDGTYTRFQGDFAVDGKIYPGAGTTYYLDDTASGLTTNGSWASGNTTISGSSSPYLVLQTTSAANKNLHIYFYQSSTALYDLGVDLGATNTQNFYLYDNVANATLWFVNTSGEFLPGSAGSQNLGNGTYYWADVSYKTLTDRGCIPLQDRWEMPGGQEMSNLEVVCALRPHPTEKTIHGAIKLDYDYVPVLARRPAPIATEDVYENAVLEEADPLRKKERKTERRLRWRKGEKMGADGVEQTLLNGVVLGAIRELRGELADLRARIKE